MNILNPSLLISALTGSILVLFIIAQIRGLRPSYSSIYLRACNSRYLKTENFDIHYIKEGSGDPVILIHGGGMWLYSYRDTIPFLSRSCTVYALDMPGYGYTRPRHNNVCYSLDVMTDTLLEFMTALQIDRASLVGHSWGGGWAIHFTHRHPEKVEKLVLIDSSGLDVPDVLEWEFLKYPMIGEILVRCIYPDGVRRRLEKSFFHKDLVTGEMVREVYTPMRFKSNQKAQYLISRNQDWKITESAMPNIAKKVLLIWGDSDRYLSPGLAEQFVTRLANVKPFILKNCGHSAHEEYPEAVSTLIKEFLEQDTTGVE
ncbi:MAG TPA: alpha/beta hydrolase [Deltaproteobacteria bacterium]|nr:alpha/beta hydrolase [Deltaproteobacteria bacterium]HPR52992.1 alpha/beta hydrolase [Deltaproteobacteria bacterium]